MTIVNRSALVPYTAAEMFSLVNDVESYPRFLPWCSSAKIHHQAEDEIRASLGIAKGGFERSFTTCNRMQADKMIEMRLLEGPFRHFEGFWRFEALGEKGCKVSLALEFEFASRIVSITVGPIFNHAASTLVDAFCKRAEDVFGKRR
ncbi:MAG: cyclase/dehydrase [Gammaproteobacteria bacterium]|nr:MAG: cyclase/dehydrase [Gammaproteobacteria bacterium]TND04761.1 MAG: cyclase/dehydrase [Gammaproteobacteria bacterium]